MRTTLDLDPRVLAASRARVSAGRCRSIGEAVSVLALAGLQVEEQAPAPVSGLLLLPVPGNSTHVITNEMVEQAMLDD
ncbi:MAG: hypothetical protein FWD83_01645 [Promicromonosporaceae bacterium]|nr:hypothetical protein [Promicromonosporaceae bacterium]